MHPREGHLYVYYAALQLHNDWTAHGGAARVCTQSPLRTSTYDSQAQIVRYEVESTSLVTDKGVRVWGRGLGRLGSCRFTGYGVGLR